MATGAGVQIARSGTAISRFMQKMNRFNKMGLLIDDVMDECNADVHEAVRRLPQHLKDERNYRNIRAAQLTILHEVLPKDQWTKYEDDFNYLKPYLEEVRMEIAEREAWNKRP